jgi:monoamine oxidase
MKVKPTRIARRDFLASVGREFGVALETFTNDNRAAVLHSANSFGGPAGTNFTNLSPQQRIDTAIAEGVNFHSEISAEAIHGFSVFWPKVPFQMGAWGTSNPATLLTGDDNIYFAGEHLSILQGWQEGAILSAYHAIDLVVAKDTA